MLRDEEDDLEVGRRQLHFARSLFHPAAAGDSGFVMLSGGRDGKALEGRNKAKRIGFVEILDPTSFGLGNTRKQVRGFHCPPDYLPIF
eukprot:3952079-Ditylum_brightwellii.AAC.1